MENPVMAAWHNETLWMVRAKRDKMSRGVPARTGMDALRKRRGETGG